MSLIESAQGVARAAYEGGSSYFRGEKPAMPRTTLAVYASLAKNFPTEMAETGWRKNFQLLSDLFPWLIALNEVTDLGISAQLRMAERTRGLQFQGLLSLTNLVEQQLAQRWTEVEGKLDESQKKTAQMAENDFRLLSLSRGEFTPSEYPSFLETDSMIFVWTCIAQTVPKVLESAGFDFPGRPCQTKADLLAKYGPGMVFSRGDFSDLSPVQRKVVGLHAAQMVMKVDDDRLGLGVDDLLGLPSFWQYAQWQAEQDSHSPRQEIVRAKQNFKEAAVACGVGSMEVFASDLLFSLFSLHQSGRAFSSVPIVENPVTVGRTLNIHAPRQSVTQRHELDGSSLLNELFGFLY